jgi:hypothetical protein
MFFFWKTERFLAKEKMYHVKEGWVLMKSQRELICVEKTRHPMPKSKTVRFGEFFFSFLGNTELKMFLRLSTNPTTTTELLGKRRRSASLQNQSRNFHGASWDASNLIDGGDVETR